MKGYIISFCMVLAALLLSTLSFLVNNSTYMTMHSLPGIALAAIVLWRLHQVSRKGLDERRHALAMMCGWLFFFVVLTGPLLVDGYPAYSTAIVLGWGIAVAMACLFHLYRNMAVGAAGVEFTFSFRNFFYFQWNS